MHINKFKISSDASNRIRVLRQRAGLTPNLLCRMAMAISFDQGSIGAATQTDEEGLEFNAYTLFGVDQAIYLGLLELTEQEVDEEVLLQRLRAHIERGIRTLSARIQNPADVAKLLGEQGRMR